MINSTPVSVQFMTVNTQSSTGHSNKCVTVVNAHPKYSADKYFGNYPSGVNIMVGQICP